MICGGVVVVLLIVFWLVNFFVGEEMMGVGEWFDIGYVGDCICVFRVVMEKIGWWFEVEYGWVFF